MTASAIVGSALAVTPAEAQTIKVKSGDSLWKLAQNYNTSVDAITSANHLKSTVISIGQTLNIPNGKSDSGSKKPSSKNSGTTKSVYTVKSGDSLWLIASDFKMSVQELKKLNGLTSDLIRAGQKLQVTGKVSSSTDQKKPRRAAAQTAAKISHHLPGRIKSNSAIHYGRSQTASI